MTLREKQSLFALNVAKLIQFIYTLPGYEVTLGEALRTQDQQYLYFAGLTFEKGNLVKGVKKSKTMDSKHLLKCAIDLNLFIHGKYITDKEPYKPLAEYWESLHPSNVAGYRWGWDANHFQMD